MTTTIDLDEVQAKLKDIITRLGPDDEVVIVDEGGPVARIVPAPKKQHPVFGSCQGMLTVVEDDDEHLQDFVEYMP